MAFRTQYIQIDGSLNIDGSLFQWQEPFIISGEVDISTLDICEYVNSSTYYDGSLMYRIMPNPSTLTNYTSEGIYAQFIAGETIGGRQCVYIMPSGIIGYADADSSTEMPAIGLNAGSSSFTAGNTYNALLFGPVYHSSNAFTIGKQIYISTTGYLTSAAPSGSADCIQVVGIAQSTDAFVFRPSPNFIQLK